MNKKFFAIMIMVFVGGICLFCFFCNSGNKNLLSADQFLRIHIRANSNSSEDQNVKYQVKDEIVKALTPILSEASTKEKALSLISQNLNLIESTANKVLLLNGFNYKSSANIKKEFFPTRTYDSITLESDVYDAVIVNLGAGNGDNWWCVAYPPMCFVSNENTSGVVYKSKLWEIIKNFFG